MAKKSSQNSSSFKSYIIFISFLGASLDGIYEGKVVEIKCPYVLSEEHPENDCHIHPSHFDERKLVTQIL